jgi:uncharacterized protein (TIGR03118 family)
MKKAISLIGLLMTMAIPSGLLAQQAGYSQTDLVSNIAGVGTTTDPQLLNPWGISVLPGQDFWIANRNGGTTTLYDDNGNKNSLVVAIPAATKNPNGNCSPGCPTGTVASGNSIYFGGGSFIFDTADGLIVSWQANDNTQVTVEFDNSASGAAYKGLALLNGTTLLAANFASGKIDVYDQNFQPTTLAGSFTDPKLPAGYAPHGVHVVNNQVYVAYAMQGTPHQFDAQPGAGLGQIDIFDTNGNFVSTFVAAGAKLGTSGVQLNAPWGVVAAPSTFEAFANDILVGNFGDGTIDAFDTHGNFMGQLTDSSGNPLVNPGLWDMVFGGGGGTGNPGTLYLTAGGSAGQPNFPAGGSTTAVFASLVPAAAVNGPGFSLSLSALSATVMAGSSTTLMISASAVGGFNSQIALTCSAPTGLTCTLSPSTISPGSSASSSTLTVSAASTPPTGGYPYMAALLPGLGVFGTLFTTRRRKPLARKHLAGMSVLGLLLLSTLFTLGCGSNSSRATPPISQTTVTVTGTSGALTNSVPVSVTVN